jgi:hypothetical protein
MSKKAYHLLNGLYMFSERPFISYHTSHCMLAEQTSSYWHNNLLHTNRTPFYILAEHCSKTGDTVSHVGIVDRVFWTIAPLTFSLVHLPFPPPLPKVNVQYIQTVCGRDGVGGGGCWVVLETIFCGSLTLCFWPDSEPRKLLYHPKQKQKEGKGSQTDKHLPQSPCTG